MPASISEDGGLYRRFTILITRSSGDTERIPYLEENHKVFYNLHKEFFGPNPIKVYRWSYTENHAFACVKRAYNKAFSKQKDHNVQMVILESLTKEQLAEKNKKQKEEKAREKKKEELQTQPGLFNEWQLQQMRQEDLDKRKQDIRNGDVR